MKNKEIYAPLRFAKSFNMDSIKEILSKGAENFGIPAKIIRTALLQEISEIEPKAVFAMTYNKYFFKDNYEGPYPTLCRFLMESKAMNRAFFENQNYKEEWTNMFAMSSMVEKWRQYKQVYLFDPEFVSALAKTEHLRIYPSLLRRLPFSCFYFDFSGIKEFQPFDGMFVYVTVHEDDSVIILGNRTIGQMYFPCSTVLEVEDQILENGIVYYDYQKALLSYAKEIRISDDHRRYSGFGDKTVSDENFPDTWMFLMQALMYLSSKEPDILENEKQKSVYRPTVKIRDKNSEIRKWDVGIRYGNKIRMSGKEKKKPEDVSNDDENILTKEKGIRKSPRPHSRCAHWAHYRTGPGRKKIELRWIEPTFVGCKTEITVVKHMVSS